MGIFRELSEDEKEKKDIFRVIRNSSLSESNKDYWITYVNGVYSESRVNDFFEKEYLIRVILEIVSLDKNDYDYEYYTDATRKWLAALIPSGKADPDYKKVIEIFITNFMTILNNDLGDYLLNTSFIALFDNKVDAIEIILNLANTKSEDVQLIFNYALEVAPYCTSQDNFRKELLSFIDGLNAVVEEKNVYYNRRLNEAKKRVGVYPIDEKTLAFISEEAEKAAKMIARLSNIQKRIDYHEERVKGITAAGKKELLELKASSIEEVQTAINNYKKTIESQLDEYLLSLETSLKTSSDETFNKLVAEAQDKLKGIKLTLATLSQTSTQELLRIKAASEASVDKLKSYVDDNESLQALLKEASTDEQVKQAILQMKNSAGYVVTDSTPGVIIPGYDRPVVPASPEVIIPESGIVTSIIPAFDERIPFDERIGVILDKMHQREAAGEIFHKEIEHVVRCIIIGDWPYLWGPSGCGKSFSIAQAFDLIGLELLENGKITDKYSLMAYTDPHGRFRATQSFIAFAYGKGLSFDELDNGNPDTEVLLNPFYSALLDVLGHPEKKKYLTFAEDMRVPVHPNFRMIAAGNTSGEGENEAFSSRGKIDESVQQRMTPIFFNYDNRVEQRIFGENTEWYDFFINFRSACDEYARRENLDTAIGIGTTRDASAIVRYINTDSKTIDQVLQDKFIQTKNAEYLAVLARYFEQAYHLDDEEYNYNGPLKDVPARVLARRFVSLSKAKMKRD